MCKLVFYSQNESVLHKQYLFWAFATNFRIWRLNFYIQSPVWRLDFFSYLDPCIPNKGKGETGVKHCGRNKTLFLLLDHCFELES